MESPKRDLLLSLPKSEVVLLSLPKRDDFLSLITPPNKELLLSGLTLEKIDTDLFSVLFSNSDTFLLFLSLLSDLNKDILLSSFLVFKSPNKVDLFSFSSLSFSFKFPNKFPLLSLLILNKLVPPNKEVFFSFLSSSFF